MLQIHQPAEAGSDKLEHKLRPSRKGDSDAFSQFWRSLWSVDTVDRLPLFFAFAACGGAALYFLSAREPPIHLILGALALSLAGLIAARRFVLVYAVGIILAGASTGLAAAALRTRMVAAPVMNQTVGPVMLEGWVNAIEPARKGVRVRLQVHAIAGMDRERMPKTVRLTHTARLAVAPGRFVRCWAVLRPPPKASMPGEYDFQRHAWYDGLGAVGYVQGRCRGGTLGLPRGRLARPKQALQTLRRRLAVYVRQAAGTRAGGFAAALVSGDRSFMSHNDREALRGSGLAHLLAISGLHMGIVGGLVFLMSRKILALIEPLALRVPVQKLAAMNALLASIAYLVLSGGSVSTQRAFIMSAVIFGAVLFDRAAISLRSYAIAMIIVILLQPESVLSPGFQMSFAASGALIATYEAWSRRRGHRRAVSSRLIFTAQSLVVTSFVAAVATAPFALYHFDRVAGLGLLANVLAMPIISFVSAPAAGLALILAPFGLSEYGLAVFGKSLEWVLAIAHWCDEFAPADLAPGKKMPAISLGLFAVSLAMAVIAQGKARLLLALPFSGAAIWLWTIASPVLMHWAPSGDVYIRSQSGQMKLYEYVKGDGLGPLRYSDMPYEGDCNIEGCQIQTEAGTTLLLNTRRGEAICFPSTEYYVVLTQEDPAPAWTRNPSCAPVLTWSHIRARGGVTLKQQAQYAPMYPPACGGRIWAPCPD